MHKEPRRRETEEDGRVEEMGRRGVKAAWEQDKTTLELVTHSERAMTVIMGDMVARWRHGHKAGRNQEEMNHAGKKGPHQEGDLNLDANPLLRQYSFMSHQLSSPVLTSSAWLLFNIKNNMQQHSQPFTFENVLYIRVKQNIKQDKI